MLHSWWSCCFLVSTYSLVLMLLLSPPAFGQKITQPPVNLTNQVNQPALPNTTSQALSRAQLFQKLRSAPVIYLGETHDRPQDHKAQLEIIQALHRQNPNLAIGLEMFQRPFQSVLDRYSRGEITEVELLEQSEYAQRWGFSWQMYAPILRFAKEHQLPLIALNTPTEVTRKVARMGLTSLTTSDLQYIPPINEIDLSNRVYRQTILEVYNRFHQGAAARPSASPGASPGTSANSPSFERFWQAQVLWDETMAQRIVQFLRQPAPAKRQLVVLVGQGHIIDGHGIPSRVMRRMQAVRTPEFRQYTLLLNPEPSLRRPGSADFWWEEEEGKP
jgi:uncharacterized iron-regulated protein